MDKDIIYNLNEHFNEFKKLSEDITNYTRLVYNPQTRDNILKKEIEPALLPEGLYQHMKKKSGWKFSKDEIKEYYKEDCLELLRDIDFSTFSRYGKNTDKVYIEARKMYNFDGFLRNYLQEILEKIEVYIKRIASDTVIIDYKKDVYFLDDDELYFSEEENQKKYSKSKKKRVKEVFKMRYLISKLIQEKEKDDLIENQIEQYGVVLPWTLFRIMTFGNIASFLAKLQPKYRDKLYDLLNQNVEKEQKISVTLFLSWCNNLRYLRNLCSHNEVLFTSYYAYGVKIHDFYKSKYKNIENPTTDNFNKKLFAYFLAMRSIINTMSSLSKDFWNEKIKQLEIESSERQVDLEKYGFPNNWLEILKIN